jgi:hypothetical protein
MQDSIISVDIEEVEHYLGELFQLPVAVCIADTTDIATDFLGYEIADMHRAANSECITAFEYVARLEWGVWSDGGCWKLMYVLYRREVQRRSETRAVEEAERRPLLEMPIGVQRVAHHYLSQLVFAARGEWQLLRQTMLLKRRSLENKISVMSLHDEPR